MSTISASTTTTTAFGVTADTTGALVLQTGATPTTAMTITTGQLVGIGTASPTVQLLNIAATSISGPTNNPAGVQLTDSGASLSSQIVNRSGNTLHNVPSTKAHSFQVNSTETVTLNTYGVGLGGTTPTSGMGIAFPATQSASSDANTLDDYEEGTWTPKQTNGTNYTVASTCRYTKIGALVYWTIDIVAVNDSTSISNMPFTSASGSNYACYIGYTDTTVTTWYGHTNPSSVNTVFFNGNASYTFLAGKRVIMAGTYISS